LALGLGFIAAYLNVLYEDVRFILGIIMQLFIYALPIFYTVEQVAFRGHNVLNTFLLNPVSAFLVSYQRALLGPPLVYAPDGVTPLPSSASRGHIWDWQAVSASLF
jgi:ABC-type polysaccharide/polyol phosphate export permease